MDNNMYSTDTQDFEHGFAFDATVDDRADFLKRTYTHLFAAVMLFIGLLSTLMQLEAFAQIATTMASGYNFLIVFLVFIGGTRLAQSMADSSTSLGGQYAGLGLFVVLWTIMFIPLMYLASVVETNYNVAIIAPAGAATVGIFAALSLIVFWTRKDFSFLGGALRLGSLIILGVIIASFFVDMNLGAYFMVFMIGFVSLYILYDTSNVLHHYRTDQYVPASLALFNSLALLFWYVIQLVMSMTNNE
ncbi:MAG: Bax inhibitor-1/YccA family protein [Planctomycetota bacterium]|jgi:FtsH-binding integral membrane protein